MPTPKILLFDIMDTVVRDPFRRELPEHFGMEFETLLERKHPTAWVEFERREIDEATFCERFFEGPRIVDREALRETLRSSYRYVDGMERLLEELADSGREMHAFSNYPVWYRIIERQLRPSRYLDWSFVSWKTGYRKPEDAAYRHVLETLDAPAEACLFVDNRAENCRAARKHGIASIEFESARALREELDRRGVSP